MTPMVMVMVMGPTLVVVATMVIMGIADRDEYGDGDCVDADADDNGWDNDFV